MEATSAIDRVPEEPPVLDDDRLAVAARTDAAAFGLLYERHVLRIFRYLRARGASEDLAGDVTAATFERALRHINSYRADRSGFSAWLVGIARNAWIDEQRRSKGDVDLAEASTLAVAGRSPEDVAIAADERRALLALVATLPEISRDALALRYAAGLTSREIGQVIGKSEAATKKLLTRSLVSLKEATRHDR